jgi:hypothetical protein
MMDELLNRFLDWFAEIVLSLFEKIFGSDYDRE